MQMSETATRKIEEIERRLDLLEAASVISYAKGTWTPTYLGAATPGVTTYTTQVGNYTKIGRVVFAQLDLVWTAATGTGVVRIGGLPFTTATGMIFAYAVQTTSMAFANGSVQGVIQGNQVLAQLFSPATNAVGTELTIEAAGTLRGMIIYFA
jgi:hypothetical protein